MFILVFFKSWKELIWRKNFSKLLNRVCFYDWHAYGIFFLVNHDYYKLNLNSPKQNSFFYHYFILFWPIGWSSWCKSMAPTNTKHILQKSGRNPFTWYHLHHHHLNRIKTCQKMAKKQQQQKLIRENRRKKIMIIVFFFLGDGSEYLYLLRILDCCLFTFYLGNNLSFISRWRERKTAGSYKRMMYLNDKPELNNKKI